jgi:cell volume regulation protein A
MTIETQLLGSAVLLILCVLASKVTGKLGIPTLVVFLAVGMLAGSEGIGQIHFNDALATQSLGIVALSYILFSGGLDTKWKTVRPALCSGIALSTLGVFCTCLLTGSFIYYVLDFPKLESYLIGAIISSTDAGAVFTVLGGQRIHLKNHLKPLLELESGSNDPMAVFLTTAVLRMMQNPDFSIYQMIPLMLGEMLIGGTLGYAFGRGLVWLFNSIKLQIEGLYTVMSVALVIFIYSMTQTLHGNGFLAVYIAGVVLGNHSFIFKKSLTLMHDGISWLMQCAMFLTLGLLTYPSEVMSVAKYGILISAFIILLGRPVSVFISLMFSKLSRNEKGLISWVGLRGSVPVILATYPLVAGVDRAGLIFNVVFFVALSSLIIQGTSVPFISRLLRVDDPFQPEKRNYSSTPGHLCDIVTVDVPENSQAVHKSIVSLNIPSQETLIVAIERNEEVIIPRGSTTLEAGDKISIMADDDRLADFVEMLWTPSAQS